MVDVLCVSEALKMETRQETMMETRQETLFPLQGTACLRRVLVIYSVCNCMAERFATCH